MGTALALLLMAFFASACAVSPSTTPESTKLPEPTPNISATVEAALAAALRATAQGIPTATTAPTVATVQPVPTSLSQEDAVALVKRYTVFVFTEDGSGSGVSLGGGRVLTNNHVVEGASRVTVRFGDGRQEPVRVLQVDPRRDLALLQSSFTDEPAAPMGDARALRAAENLFVVGYPRTTVIGAQEATVTRGIFSARWQSPQGVWHVQTDAPMNSGNSGGPVADAQARLAGVATWGVRGAAGLNFAVAGDEIAAFLEGGGEPPSPPSAAAQLPPSARPELGGHAVAPRSMAPGGSITLSYTVNNPSGQTVPTVLGASIRPAGGGAWIDDPANDTTVSVPPGGGTYTRSFRVPLGTPAGSYDVAWGMFSPDKQKSYGLEVEPGSLAVVSSGPALPAPPAPAPLPTTAPADAVRQFYAFINGRNFSAAWNLFSPRYQATLSYDGWVGGYQTTRSVQTPSVRTTAQSGGTASVDVTIVSVVTAGTGTVTKTFQGTWGMVLVNGSWKLDNPSIKQVG